MYKTKVWIHQNEKDLLSNKADFWIDMTFIEEPIDNSIITITKDLILDIQDNFVWEKFYGPGLYKVIKAENMFIPEKNDGFSFSILAYKL